MVTSAPCGEWQSPITSNVVAGKTIALSEPSVTRQGQVYWLELRPLENGRVVLATTGPDGVVTVSPPEESGINVRTRVHEYGGGAYLIVEDTLYFSNYKDQRLYSQSLKEPSAAATPITGEDTQLRFANAVWDAPRQRLVCVTEDHSKSGEPLNTISSVDVATGAVTVLASGCDFYSSPTLDAASEKLAWIQWQHPNMPWDGTELMVADVSDVGELLNARKVAGGQEEAVQQPGWDQDGGLCFVSDPTGWWNLYRYTPAGQTLPLYPAESEFAVVPWTLGRNSYTLLPDGRLLTIFIPSAKSAGASLGVLDPKAKKIEAINTGFTAFGTSLHLAQLQDSSGFKVVFVGGSPTQSSTVVSLQVESVEQLLSSSPTDWQVHQVAMEVQMDSAFLSQPQSLSFPTTNGEVAYMYYYPPANPDFQVPSGEKPPLLIKSHGGPTSSASTNLDLKIQYFTSRGYAVADVNYRGSTGYGREFRNRLRGQWGVLDLDDCSNAALYLAKQGFVDPKRCCISGGSAGGFTTLACLAFRDVFAAGASYFGVADITALAKDTHKFESRYLDLLVGPYPEAADVYKQRSPSEHVDSFNCPIIFFQGTDDRVVPPNQAEEMHAAVKAKGLPTALVMFEGEAHGFCKAESIRRSLDGELYFYGRVLGFNAPLPSDLEPINIENM